MSLKMFVVNCPKTRNQEFGEFLEALTEKYCETVMKLDKLTLEFETLKEKNDAVIDFQKENFHKHDSELEKIVDMQKDLESRQDENQTKCLEIIDEKTNELNYKLEENKAWLEKF